MTQKKLFGILLVVLGAIFLLNALNIFTVNIFFDGWWTLFLIITAVISMSKQGITTGNSILLIIGIVLLLNEIVDDEFNFKAYLVPAVLIILGIGLLFKK